MLKAWATSIGMVLASMAVSTGAAVAGEADGKAMYNAKCAMCHGSDGVAKSMWAKRGARNFNDPVWQKEKTDEVITKVVTDGIAEKKMPAYKDKMKPEEIAAIVKHIRSLAPAK